MKSDFSIETRTALRIPDPKPDVQNIIETTTSLILKLVTASEDIQDECPYSHRKSLRFCLFKAAFPKLFSVEH